MKRIICMMLCLLLLCGQVFAAKTNTVEDVIRTFIAENGLNESNFSVSYYNTKTGEGYAYNDDAFFAAGALWTLPLHMYYYEQETKGAFEPTMENPEEFTINGMTLADCRYRSIILTDEATSEAMRTALGGVEQYQELINSLYGKLDRESLPAEYWQGTAYSAKFMMNCLRTISARPEQFGDMMANYRIAQKADAFAGFQKSYTVVQVRGEADGFVCAAAEITAPQPYLLVAFVSEKAGGDALLSKLNETVCAYVEEQFGIAPTEAPTEPTTGRNASDYYIGQDRIEKDNSTLTDWFVTAFAVAGAVAVVLIAILLIWRRIRKK